MSKYQARSPANHNTKLRSQCGSQIPLKINVSWRASETLSGVTQSRFRYIYLFIYLFIWYVGPLFPPGLLIVKREELRVSHF